MAKTEEEANTKRGAPLFLLLHEEGPLLREEEPLLREERPLLLEEGPLWGGGLLLRPRVATTPS